MVTIYLECIIVYQADHYFIPLLACSAGVFIGHANGFARESAMLKLPKKGGKGASHVHLDRCICTTLIIYIMVLYHRLGRTPLLGPEMWNYCLSIKKSHREVQPLAAL